MKSRTPKWCGLDTKKRNKRVVNHRGNEHERGLMWTKEKKDRKKGKSWDM